MYCPSCGSEERQPSQYCRACGTELRAVRMVMERPDAITASAVSAREQISRALGERIRQLETGRDLKHVAEDVLPQLEKFLESPEEKRLRRIRAGVITAGVGFGVSLLLFLLSIDAHDLLPFIPLGLITFFIGIGLIINGFMFTAPRKKLSDLSAEARAQKELDSRGSEFQTAIRPQGQTTNELPAARVSVTEHTTHQLKPQKLD